MFVLFSCLIIGFGVKSAIVPLHTWLPDAHPEAPSPISALLSGIVIETGLYGLTRVLFLLFDPSFFKLAIAALAVLTMTLANITALLQQDIKRLLAYSSIAQIGYMLVGVSAGTAYGIMGVFLHVFNHSLMKGLAFLSSGSIVHKAETRDIQSLQGVGRIMPYTTLTLYIALLGLGGVPATNGFISKFILFNSAIGAGMPLLAVIGVLNSAFSMAYYLRVMKTFISTPEDESLKVGEAPPLMVGVTVVMAALIIIFGIYPMPVIDFANRASKALVEELGKYIEAVLL
jgi:multicomponent Na+:H+ antiporter subunit D